MLLVQQFLTRIFSILFNSGLAFLAISTTFLGLGSAGVAVCLLPRLFAPERSARQVPRIAFAYALSLVGGVVALVKLDSATDLGRALGLVAQVQAVLGASLLMLPAMALVGLVISLVLRTHAARVNRLYGADLLGGGVGCLLVLPLMSWIGGDSGVFAIGALAALGAACLAYAHGNVGGNRRVGMLALAAAALFAAAPALNRGRGLLDVRSHATDLSEVSHWVLEDREVATIWNPLARLGIFETLDQSALYVRIDSSCQTGIPSQEPRFTQQWIDSADFERLPWVLDRHARYLEIGAGGGRGMLMAKALGSRRIVGVEINPGITSSSMGGFPGFGVGDWTRADPEAELVTAEGRSHSRVIDEKFDTVTITFIQTRVADGSAAFALSEANLFTTEAFTGFLSLLDEDGLFYVFRQGGNELLRLITMARDALAELGIRDVRSRLFLARNETNRSILMLGMAPFTSDEVAKLDRTAQELGLEILYSPSGAPGPRPANPFLDHVADLRASGELTMTAVADLYDRWVHAPDAESLEATYVKTDDPESFRARSIVDISAPTDDRPYYFFTGIADWRDFGLYFDVAGVRILGGTVILLFWMGAAFTALVALLIALPLAFRRGAARPSTGLAVLGYFSGLGLGYIAVQISFIQRFSLFLGHPVYAISVVLLGFLLASGAGSMASDRLFRGGLLTFGRALALLAGLLVAWNFVLPLVFHSDAITWPVPAKIATSLVLILPLGFAMGLFFPQGIRLVDRAAPALVPWAWGANSAASIVGSIFSLIFAIHFGFSATALAAAVAYVAFCSPSAAVLRRAAGSED
jgi:hypothetical protein